MRTVFLAFTSPIWLLLWLSVNLCLTAYRAIIEAILPRLLGLMVLALLDYQPAGRLYLPMPLWGLLEHAYKRLPDRASPMSSDGKYTMMCGFSSWY